MNDFQTKERALAHVEVINDIQPIENADKIEVATVLGWKIVVSKNDNYSIGDKIIYIEIDSKVPETADFEFLAKRKYRVRTIKLRGQLSQGLIMPISLLKKDYEVGADVTKELGITYYVAEDNKRKAKSLNKYEYMALRHKKLFAKNPVVKSLYKSAAGRKILFAFLGSKKDKKVEWPVWVRKTDETRIQNIPDIINDKSPWVATEKIDGMSATYTLKKTFFGRKYYICSRNIVIDNDANAYSEISERYNIRSVLTTLMDMYQADWVTLQGEIFGNGIQKRIYGMDGIDFRAFNLIVSNKGRIDTCAMAVALLPFGIKSVPIIDESYVLPDSVDKVLVYADGISALDGGMREGIVFRSQDGAVSFKAVSNEYLLNKGE